MHVCEWKKWNNVVFLDLKIIIGWINPLLITVIVIQATALFPVIDEWCVSHDPPGSCNTAKYGSWGPVGHALRSHMDEAVVLAHFVTKQCFSGSQAFSEVCMMKLRNGCNQKSVSSDREMKLLKQQIWTGCRIELVSHHSDSHPFVCIKEVRRLNKPQLTRKKTPLI